jgi:hypothetical protein
MQDLVFLTWTSTPAEFFEAPITVVRDDYEMTIDNGKAEARIGPPKYAANPMRAEIHSALEARFLSAQVIVCRPYVLSKSAMKSIYPDGHCDVTVELAH